MKLRGLACSRCGESELFAVAPGQVPEASGNVLQGLLGETVPALSTFPEGR